MYLLKLIRRLDQMLRYRIELEYYHVKNLIFASALLWLNSFIKCVIRVLIFNSIYNSLMKLFYSIWFLFIIYRAAVSTESHDLHNILLLLRWSCQLTYSIALFFASICLFCSYLWNGSCSCFWFMWICDEKTFATFIVYFNKRRL